MVNQNPPFVSSPVTLPSPPLFHKRPSTLVLSRFESILYPQSYCSSDHSRIHSPFDQEVCLDRLRTPHDSTFPNAAPAHRPLDHRRRGWRNQHRISRRQLARRLLLPRQGRQGRFTRRNSSDPAQRNHHGRSCARPLLGPRPAHRTARRRRDRRGRRDRTLRISARRRRLEVVAVCAACCRRPLRSERRALQRSTASHRAAHASKRLEDARQRNSFSACEFAAGSDSLLPPQRVWRTASFRRTVVLPPRPQEKF